MRTHIRTLTGLTLTAAVVAGANPSLAHSADTTIPVGQRPLFSAVDTTANKIYVTNSGSDSVSVIDAATNTVVDTIQINGNPAGIAVDTPRHKIYVTSTENDSFSIIDGNTTRVTTISLRGILTNPSHVAVDEARQKIYISSVADGKVFVLDGRNENLLATIPIPGGVGGGVLEADATRHQLYVSSSWGVIIVDTVADAIAGTLYLDHKVTDLVADAEHLYISDVDNEVHVYTLGRNRELKATIPVGNAPFGIAVCDHLHEIYVSNWADGTLSVIDHDTNKVTRTVPVGKNPAGITVSMTSHEVYVPNFGANTVTAVAPIR